MSDTQQHDWIRIVITPVQVMHDPTVSDEPIIYSSEADDIEAQECAQYGCSRCDEALTAGTLGTPCKPEETAGIKSSHQEE